MGQDEKDHAKAYFLGQSNPMESIMLSTLSPALSIFFNDLRDSYMARPFWVYITQASITFNSHLKNDN